MFFRRSRFSAWAVGAGVLLALAAALCAPAAAQAVPGFFRTVWTSGDGAPAGIRQIAQDGNGWLLLASQSGLYRFDGERFERLTAIDGNKFQHGALLSVAVLEGALWVGYQGGGVERFQNGVATYFGEDSGLPRAGVTQLVQARAGVVSAATPNGLFEWDGKRWLFVWPGSRLAQDAPVQALAVAADKALWLTNARDGAGAVLRREPGTQAFVAVEAGNVPAGVRRALQVRRAPGSDALIPSFDDREGNQWLATSAGLERLRPNRAHALALAGELHYPSVVPLGQGGALVANGAAGALRRVAADGSADDSGLPDARRVLPGRQGAAWAADTTHLVRVAGGAQQQWDLPVAGSLPQSLAEDKDGGVWMTLQGRRELYRLQAGKWVVRRETMGYSEMALLLHVDADNHLWQAYTDSKLAVTDGTGTTRYSAKDGLRTGDVTSIATRGGHLWVGGEAALMLLREGSFVAVTARDGSDFVGVTGIVATAQGELWLHTQQGVLRIGAAEVQRVLKGGAPQVAFERFDDKDGVAGHALAAGPLPSLHEAPDGRIWYSTDSAVGWIDPHHDGRTLLAPPLVVRSLSTPAGSFALADSMRLPEGSEAVRIDYAAPLLSLPERLRFRYKLDGVDADWVDAGTRRSAIYTGLDAGDYRFQVQAVSESGVWNTAGASQAFSIAPTLLQALWFRLVLIAGVLLALGLLHRWRLKRYGGRLRARLVARLDERTRIAREVHDTLAQPVQALLLKVRDASARLAPQEPVRALLENAAAAAEDDIAQSAGRLRELRSRAAGRELPVLFEMVGREVGGEAGVPLAVQVTGAPRELAPGVGGELLYIGREAIVNAYRHAGASKIALLLDYGPKELRLIVSDDGKGIDDAALAGAGAGIGAAANGDAAGGAAHAGVAHHSGLAGMRERAGRLGATLAWRRLPGGGTECLLTVRAKKAYDSGRGAASVIRGRQRR